MPNHACCAFGICDNNNRYLDLFTIRSHVDELKFHRWHANPELAEIWRKQVSKGRKEAEGCIHSRARSTRDVCLLQSFPMAKRTPRNRATDYPTICLTSSDLQMSKSPKKRKTRRSLGLIDQSSAANTESESSDEEPEANAEETDSEMDDCSVPVRIQFVLCNCFEHLTRNSDVKTFTGLPTAKVFESLFEHLSVNTCKMRYWRGGKQTIRESPRQLQGDGPEITVLQGRPGPQRSLSLPRKCY